MPSRAFVWSFFFCSQVVCGCVWSAGPSNFSKTKINRLYPSNIYPACALLPQSHPFCGGHWLRPSHGRQSLLLPHPGIHESIISVRGAQVGSQKIRQKQGGNVTQKEQPMTEGYLFLGGGVANCTSWIGCSFSVQFLVLTFGAYVCCVVEVPNLLRGSLTKIVIQDPQMTSFHWCTCHLLETEASIDDDLVNPISSLSNRVVHQRGLNKQGEESDSFDLTTVWCAFVCHTLCGNHRRVIFMLSWGVISEEVICSYWGEIVDPTLCTFTLKHSFFCCFYWSCCSFSAKEAKGMVFCEKGFPARTKPFINWLDGLTTSPLPSRNRVETSSTHSENTFFWGSPLCFSAKGATGMFVKGLPAWTRPLMWKQTSLRVTPTRMNLIIWMPSGNCHPLSMMTSTNTANPCQNTHLSINSTPRLKYEVP